MQRGKRRYISRFGGWKSALGASVELCSRLLGVRVQRESQCFRYNLTKVDCAVHDQVRFVICQRINDEFRCPLIVGSADEPAFDILFDAAFKFVCCDDTGLLDCAIDHSRHFEPVITPGLYEQLFPHLALSRQ